MRASPISRHFRHLFAHDDRDDFLFLQPAMHALESLTDKGRYLWDRRLFVSSRPFSTARDPLMAHVGVHSLPVELLVRVFEFGTRDAPNPDLQPPGEPTFEVLASHVCQFWREVALRTPSLWTLIHFRTVPHLARARAYLSRSGTQLLNVFLDTCSQDEYVPDSLLFRDEFLPAFAVVTPHIDRWRSLYLKVRDLTCKRFARDVLSTCGAAVNLTSLTLWHIEDWGTSERLYTAIGPPPVVVFNGLLPSLQHVNMTGVNLPWAHSPFLRGLISIEFALHSDDVRIPFPHWRDMLASSPQLERLSLTYAGPRAGAGDWEAPARVSLPALKELRLTDLDPPYLCALMRTIDAPNVITLHVELSDQDFTSFAQILVTPPPPSDGPFDPMLPWAPAPPPADADADADADAPGPLFPRVETLSIGALECTLESLHALLASMPRVRHLEAAFGRMPEGAFGLLVQHSGPPALEGALLDLDLDLDGKGKGEGRGRAGGRGPREDAPLLPVLASARLLGVGGHALRTLMDARRANGRTVRGWYVHDRWWDEECERLMNECRRAGDAERVEWFEGEEGAEEDEADGGAEEEGEGDGDGAAADGGDGDGDDGGAEEDSGDADGDEDDGEDDA